MNNLLLSAGNDDDCHEYLSTILVVLVACQTMISRIDDSGVNVQFENIAAASLSVRCTAVNATQCLSEAGVNIQLTS